MKLAVHLLGLQVARSSDPTTSTCQTGGGDSTAASGIRFASWVLEMDDRTGGTDRERDMKVASRGGEASRGKRRWVWSDPQMDGGTVSKTFLVGLGAPKKKRVRLVGTRSFGLEAWRG